MTADSPERLTDEEHAALAPLMVELAEALSPPVAERLRFALAEGATVRRMSLPSLDVDLVKLARFVAARQDDAVTVLSTALEDFVTWSEAYPTDIFPEPDLSKARALLQAGGMTLDAISAYIMRRAVVDIGKRARVALAAVTR